MRYPSGAWMRTWIAETWSRRPRNALGARITQDERAASPSTARPSSGSVRRKLELRNRERGTGADHGEAETDGVQAAADPLPQVCQIGNVFKLIPGIAGKRFETEQRHPGRLSQIGGDAVAACSLPRSFRSACGGQPTSPGSPPAA